MSGYLVDENVLAIQNEIDAHGKTWCHPDCEPYNTFIPEAYRDARLSGCTAENAQQDYDGCHMFR